MTRLDKAVQDLVDATLSLKTTPEGIYLLAETVSSQAVEAGDEARNRALAIMANAMTVATAQGASVLAETCRSLSDEGADFRIVAHPLLARLASILRSAAAFSAACDLALEDWQEDGEYTRLEIEGMMAGEMPDESLAWAAVEPMCVSAAALLARSREARSIARANAELTGLVYKVAETETFVAHLERLLEVLDDEDLFVFYPSLGRGYRVMISGIGDNDQLHTLLAAALVGDPAEGWLPGERPDTVAVAIARGVEAREENVFVKGVFHMEGWGGLREDMSLGRPASSSRHWIWGGGAPADIPKFEGKRIVLLGPLAVGRTWRARPGLVRPADLRVVGVLSAGEVRAWLERILAALGGGSR